MSNEKKKSEIFNEIAKDMGEKKAALIVMDVQKEFCDPLSKGRGTMETAAVTDKIVVLIDEMRKRGVPIVFVHYNMDKKENPGFYKAIPQEGDIVIRKTKDDVFDCPEAKFAEEMKSRGIKRLQFCGFNLCSCVFNSCKSGVKNGFDVVLYSQETGQGLDDGQKLNNNQAKREIRNEMRNEGVQILESEPVMAATKKLKMQP